MPKFEPGYRKLHASGELAGRAETASGWLADCRLCPRDCGADRLHGKQGRCGIGAKARVSSFGPHFGEEDVLVGRGGSGTIFMTSCSLLCNFCQNYDISHMAANGEEMDDGELAAALLGLARRGCHNINFVTPTHVVPQILRALVVAAEKGLDLPLVYNSSGYDKVETLKLLDGVFDIYMPDFKFWDSKVAEDLCDAPDYPEAARAALAEMHRQVGVLATDEDGIAFRGVLVRHLAMPNGLAGTADVMRFLSEELSPDTFVNVMAQYRPYAAAHTDPRIGRRVTPEEYREALAAAARAGLRRVARQ